MVLAALVLAAIAIPPTIAQQIYWSPYEEICSNVTIPQFTASCSAGSLEARAERFHQIIVNELYECLRTGQQQMPPLNETEQSSPQSQGRKLLLPLSISLSGAAALLVILLFVLYYRRTWGWSRVPGKARKAHPGAGAETVTLVVTDIQDSTMLWELLPAEVMDRTLREHHRVLRHLLHKHNGYESVTEGDSFTLAFHAARDAVCFAVDAQMNLIKADWPSELLNTDLCKPVHASHMPVNQPDSGSGVDALSSSYNSIPTPTGQPRTRSAAPHTYFDEGPAGMLPVSLVSMQNRSSSNLSFVGERPSRARSLLSAMSFGSKATRRSSELLMTPPSLGSPAGVRRRSSLSAWSMWGGRSSANSEQDSIGTTEDTNTASCSFLMAAQTTWHTVKPDSPDQHSVLLFRGLKVRMGIHTGPCDVAGPVLNPGDHRFHYSGALLAMVKAVAEAAPGGMVLISGATYQELPMEQLWDRTYLLHIGEHKLAVGEENTRHVTTHTTNLYQVMDRGIWGRVALLRPARVAESVTWGSLEAPLGCVTVTFMNVVGAKTLLALNRNLATVCIAMMQEASASEMRKHNGYQVEATDSLVLASFGSPVDALTWALETQRTMLKLNWPQELLEHELGEAITVTSGADHSVRGSEEFTLLFRGLRIKFGVDTSNLFGSIHAVTGRMTYRGRGMNRAARIANTAASGQVLCSGDTWRLMHRLVLGEQEADQLDNLDATSLGSFRLKGVSGEIEIYKCRLRSDGGLRAMHTPVEGSVAEPEDEGTSRRSTGSITDGGGVALAAAVAASQMVSRQKSLRPRPERLLSLSMSRPSNNSITDINISLSHASDAPRSKSCTGAPAFRDSVLTAVNGVDMDSARQTRESTSVLGSMSAIPLLATISEASDPPPPHDIESGSAASACEVTATCLVTTASRPVSPSPSDADQCKAARTLTISLSGRSNPLSAELSGGSGTDQTPDDFMSVMNALYSGAGGDHGQRSSFESVSTPPPSPPAVRAPAVSRCQTMHPSDFLDSKLLGGILRLQPVFHDSLSDDQSMTGFWPDEEPATTQSSPRSRRTRSASRSARAAPDSRSNSSVDLEAMMARVEVLEEPAAHPSVSFTLPTQRGRSARSSRAEPVILTPPASPRHPLAPQEWQAKPVAMRSKSLSRGSSHL